jgi:hypothetical protein
MNRPDARSERGFSMFLVIVAMLVTAMFVAAGFAAANGDLPVSGVAKERKSAYASAEAGLHFYLNRLQLDPDYWTKCDTGPAPNDEELNPVNQRWNGAGEDPRRWRSLPDGEGEYTIELLPAPGATTCDATKQQTFVDMNTGTFKVRVTGRSHAGVERRRSIVATFRRDSFLNFVYFTQYENLDPSAFADWRDRQEQQANCTERYRSQRQGKGCLEIQFASADEINGPLHTDDENLLICGSPTFGRTKNEDGSSRATKTDTVEVGGGGSGHKANPANASCSDSPTINTPTGAFTTNAKRLPMPESNDTLEKVADNSGSLYRGKTLIRLRGSVMDIINGGTTRTGVAWPTSGVLYVANGAGSCTPEVPTDARYGEQSTCGNVYVSGTYSKPLTIAAANDVIVWPTSSAAPTDANLTMTANSEATLGLIANNFVRVGHRVSSCTNSDPVIRDIQIDAAILSLRHSFIVDNYQCGSELGKLTVRGAIVQKYRGPVGTGNGVTVSTGFAKNYWYDDRFRYRSPPYFLTPVAASWDVIRSHEQVPAS